MKRNKSIFLLVTVALLMLPSLLRAQQVDTLGIAIDINIVDSEDSVATAPSVKDDTKKKSRKDLKKETDTLVFDRMYLDTVVIKKKNVINDYSMIGVQYGAGIASATFNPSREQRFVLAPVNFGMMYTRYGKMFGFMPYFGFQIGGYYNTEGYRFKYDDETGKSNYTESGADRAIIRTVDGTMNAHCHMDFWKMKIIINLGYYVGYRLSIARYYQGELFNSEFTDWDRRFDYGVKGGAGFGLVFDPIEFHLTATFKQSFQNLYEPNYNSEYYYRYAYPYSVVISAGIHVQLTKRVGKTTKQIKAEARDKVFNPDTDDSKRSEDRTESIFGRF